MDICSRGIKTEIKIIVQVDFFIDRAKAETKHMKLTYLPADRIL
jgi:hypothetical protein